MEFSLSRRDDRYQFELLFWRTDTGVEFDIQQSTTVGGFEYRSSVPFGVDRDEAGDIARALLSMIEAEGFADEFAEYLPALVAEVERLREAVALHQPDRDFPCCVQDGYAWPCPTARAAGER